jgi:hypothetical protein
MRVLIFIVLSNGISSAVPKITRVSLKQNKISIWDFYFNPSLLKASFQRDGLK